MKIGAFARETGISARMIRYYESQGLLKPGRTATGYRVYGAHEREVMRRIRLLTAAGVSTALLQRVAPCLDSAEPVRPCPEVRALLLSQRDRIDHQIVALGETRTVLNDLLNAGQGI